MGLASRKNMIRRAYLAALPLLLAGAAAEAQIAPKDASYSCAAEFAGGIRYNEQTKRWEGPTLKPEAKFVMRMQHVRSIKRKNFRGKDEPAQVFDVTITKADSNTPLPCYSWQVPSRSVVLGGVDMSFGCFGALHEHQFDLKTNRFLISSTAGYIFNTDNNNDTPIVIGGTCTKIDPARVGSKR